jgi:putative PIN family toxin of toxin-antitoxin system
MGKSPRVFFDTNVIFSGMYAQSGPPARLLHAYAEGRLIMVLSSQVLEELVRTIRIKLPHALPGLYLLLASNPPEIFADPDEDDVARWTQVIHPADAPILAAAAAARVDYLVTGNTTHFVDNRAVAGQSGLRIVTPAQLVNLLGL